MFGAVKPIAIFLNEAHFKISKSASTDQSIRVCYLVRNRQCIADEAGECTGFVQTAYIMELHYMPYKQACTFHRWSYIIMPSGSALTMNH